MYIGTIVEDTLNSNCSFLKNEHGLSLYIKYNNKNILFRTCTKKLDKEI